MGFICYKLFFRLLQKELIVRFDCKEAIMNMIRGIVRDKNKKPLRQARVALLNERFEVEFSAEANENGEFSLKADTKNYPYFIATKEYKTNYLEYWAYNIRLENDIVINPKLDRLEIFSLIFFPSLDADYSDSMMVYFRPMSLSMFLSGEKNIAPDISMEDITVSINDEFQEILGIKVVREVQSQCIKPITAYAVKITSENLEFNGKNRLEISITDKNGDYGEASLFF